MVILPLVDGSAVAPAAGGVKAWHNRAGARIKMVGDAALQDAADLPLVDISMAA
jgi:hypothetical protein